MFITKKNQEKVKFTRFHFRFLAKSGRIHGTGVPLKRNQSLLDFSVKKCKQFSKESDEASLKISALMASNADFKDQIVSDTKNGQSWCVYSGVWWDCDSIHELIKHSIFFIEQIKKIKMCWSFYSYESSFHELRP